MSKESEHKEDGADFVMGSKKEMGPEVSDMDTRNQRVDELRAKVEELFPGKEAKELRENIDRSFLVPQWGDYHNEGMMMDSHLRTILDEIDNIAEGAFHDLVPESAREAMQRTLERDRGAVEQYVFLHDISKADCMTLKFDERRRTMGEDEWTGVLDGAKEETGLDIDTAALQELLEKHGATEAVFETKGVTFTIDGKETAMKWKEFVPNLPPGNEFRVYIESVRKTIKSIKDNNEIDKFSLSDTGTDIFFSQQAVTWEDWTDMLSQTADGQAALNGDEAALKRFCEEQDLNSISYQQIVDGEAYTHGAVGAEELRKAGLTEDKTIITAIEKHEVAFMFSGISAPTYDLHFGPMTDEERDFAVTASYVDTMASLRAPTKENGLKERSPDMSNFSSMVASKEKAEQYPELLMGLADGGVTREVIDVAVAGFREGSDKEFLALVKEIAGDKFDAQKLVNKLGKLRTNKDPITRENLAELEEAIKKETELPKYNPELIRKGLAGFIEDETLTSDDVEEIVRLAVEDPKGIGRTFGRKLGRRMGELTKVLKDAIE